MGEDYFDLPLSPVPCRPGALGVDLHVLEQACSAVRILQYVKAEAQPSEGFDDVKRGIPLQAPPQTAEGFGCRAQQGANEPLGSPGEVGCLEPAGRQGLSLRDQSLQRFFCLLVYIEVYPGVEARAV